MNELNKLLVVVAYAPCPVFNFLKNRAYSQLC